MVSGTRYGEGDGEDGSGNGSIMRLAPVPIFCLKSGAVALEKEDAFAARMAFNACAYKAIDL